MHANVRECVHASDEKIFLVLLTTFDEKVTKKNVKKKAVGGVRCLSIGRHANILYTHRHTFSSKLET